MYNFFHGLPRPREIEIEWHVGRIAAATGPLVALGAPGPDLGPNWSTKTKGDRDRVACRSNTTATGASVAVGAPRPNLGPGWPAETKGHRGQNLA
ncbi:Hypothetical predicted protein [Olea europaea subsp. europaea]|uniref:Uncharacterized protein n=1 Tax=Olea europaea subsp. europaea TaxID=158383 RepID=A0A8S0S756_OLEEU|nr:Hypothetical predicted protein [Olea europaea subsp. europaea]